ncbi:MAG TPA: TonB-dependent receptor [Thermoanaerobaculia bacterium]|nr:TonB-dependent receptor [Thermoanaerobaculia bacterium]
MRLVRPSLVLLLILCSLPSTLFAQSLTQSGNIRGTITGSDGTPLPGVTVLLTGDSGRQTFVTATDGEYRFLGLDPGTYTITAELSGFAATTRKADVLIGRNTELTMQLSAAASEAITVTAATPVIDTRETATGQTVEQMELVNVPTARDPWVVLQSIPGVLVDRVNVGGNESGQQSYFVGKGVERHQTEWNIDGVAVSDMATTGTSAFYYDFDSFEQIQVSTGSSDPSVRTPGVHLNMVTKRGTNDLSGSGRFFTTDEDWQAEATIPAEAVDYLDAGANSINHIDDYGIEAGGPIITDKLWLWGAYSNNGINNFSTGEGSLPQKTKLNNVNAKLNYQPFNNNTAEVFYMWNEKQVAGRGLGPTRATIEVAQKQTGPGDLIKFEDTHVFSQNLYLTATYAQIKNGYKLDPIGGRDVDAYWVDPDIAGTEPWKDIQGGWQRTYRYFEQNVPQKNARIDGSFHLPGRVNHELKFGFGYRDTPVDSITVWSGNGNFGNFYDGYALAALTRPAVPNFGSRYADLYLGDTVIFNNLTLTGGVRYDIQRARNFGSSVPANPVVPDLLPATSYEGDERALEWKGFSPRIGATLALGEERKTVLRGSYNRYMDQLGSSDVGASNPFYRVQMLYYYWEDLNGDKTIQRGEIDFDSGLYSFSNIDPDNPAAGYSPGRIDYDMDPTRTDEFVLGAEREILSNFAVGVAYSYRKRTNFTWDAYEKTRGAGDYYTSADYVLLPTRVTGTLPNGNAYSIENYRLNASLDDPVFYVTTNRPDYHQTYHGLELTATKRWSNRWMVRGNVTLSDWKQHIGPDGFVDPTHIVEGDSCTSCDGDVVGSSGGVGGYISSRWAYSFNAVYEAPFKLMFGAAVIGREGYIEPYFRRVNNRDGVGAKDIMVVDEFGSSRLPDLFNLDLRVARDFAVTSGMVLNLSIDLFNVTNERTVLWRDNRLYTADGPDTSENNWIEQMQSPRVWRVGARVRF